MGIRASQFTFKGTVLMNRSTRFYHSETLNDPEPIQEHSRGVREGLNAKRRKIYSAHRKGGYHTVKSQTSKSTPHLKFLISGIYKPLHLVSFQDPEE